MEERDIFMSSARFLDHIREGYEAGLRYCFILGSGASVASGIKSGRALTAEWRQYLLERQARSPGYIQECAATSHIPPEDYRRLFAPDYTVSSEDYFTFYDLRFAGKPVQAYTYLQKLMEKAEPSFGYYALAVLLENTENKLVITTNFDSLVEDTLLLYHAQHPLVVGHESLAPFIGKKESAGRPIVAKVHRDLFLHPLNREKELSELDERWKRELRTAFSRYIPIVIGYAGGDQTLMKLLESIPLDEIYWCSRHKSESARITTLLQRQPGGYLVHIQGFDEIMFELLSGLMQDIDYDPPGKRMREYVEKRSKSYDEQYQKISQAVMDSSGAERVPPGGGADEQEGGGLRAKAPSRTLGESLQTLEKMAAPEGGAESDAEKANRLWLGAVRAHKDGRFDEALRDKSEAIRLDPANAKYYYSRSATLYSLREYEKALKDDTEAIRLAPGEAKFYDSRGVTLHQMGRLSEALRDKSEAIRLAPGEAKYYLSRGLTYQKLGQYDKALADKSEAVRLDPENPKYYHSRAVTYHTMKQYDKALRDRCEAVRLDPANAKYYDGRSVTLHEMGRYDEALRDDTEAIRLDPANAEYYESRAVTLSAMNRRREAEADRAEAKRLRERKS